MNKINKQIILSLTIFNLQAMVDQPEESRIYDMTLRECNQALSRGVSSVSTISCATDNSSRELANVSLGQMALSEYDFFARITGLFKMKWNSNRETIPAKTIQKLELLTGKNENNRSHSVLSMFPLRTAAGKLLLAKRLISKYNVDEVNNFQKLVKMFSSRIEDCTRVREHLEVIKNVEPVLLSLWESDFNFQDLIYDYVTKRIPEVPLLGVVGAENIGFVNATTADYQAQKRWWHIFTRWFLNKFTKENAKNDAYIETLKVLMQKKTDSMLRFLGAIRSIHNLIKNVLVANDNDPEISRSKSKLENFLNKNETKYLIDLKRQLDETESSMTKLGLYFQITSLLYSMKPNFLKIYKALGTIDQLTSIAHLTASQARPFRLVQFNDKSQASFKLEDYWNCMLPNNNDADIVKNSLEVKKDAPHFIVIGGINGTGKTTALRAISLCIHLGSTIGVAPAKQCIMPKPLKVLASLDERDNLASYGQGGLSLFNAQIQALVNIAKDISNNQALSIVAIDEPCTATSEDDAMIAMKNFFEKILPFKQRFICLLTTHIEGLRNHAEQAPKNFRLLVGKEDYKLTDGENKSIDYKSVEDTIRSMFNF